MKKFVYICVLVSLFSLFCPVVYATSTEQTYDDISEYLQDYSPVTDEHIQDYEASTGLANWENSISDYDTSYYSSGNRLWTVLLCLCAIIIFVDLERLFKKAGYAGWEAFILGHNVAVICEIAGGSGFVAILFSIPYYIGAILQIVMAVGVYSNILISALTIFSTVVGVLEIILTVVMLYKFARAYGANIFLAVLSVLLAPIGYTILAFSKLYEYEYCVKESKNEDK